MADGFTVSLDIKEAVGLMTSIHVGLEDRQSIHRLCIIQLQKWVVDNWPKGPPLSPITVGSRRKGSSLPLLDTGALRNSVVGRSPATSIGSENAATQEVGIIGSSLIYARIHQYGGVIRAKNAKNLAIPLTRRARAAGSPRNFGDELSFVPSRRTGVSGLLIERPKGKPFTLHYVMRKSIKRNGRTIETKSGKPFMIPVSSQAKSAQKSGSRLGKDLIRIPAKKGADPATLGYLVEPAKRRKMVAHYLLKPSVYIPARPYIPTANQAAPVCAKVAQWYVRQLTRMEPTTLPEAA